MRTCAKWSGVPAIGAAALLLALGPAALAATPTSGGQAPAAYQPATPLTIEQRAAGAERVVVATIEDVTAGYETNEFGDRLIISHARLRVEEAFKGSAEPIILDYEGGTVDGITLHVSNLPVLGTGERAVFFVARGRRGQFIPHLRGQGIVKLDPQNRVPNSSLTLDDVRRMSRSQSR